MDLKHARASSLVRQDLRGPMSLKAGHSPPFGPCKANAWLPSDEAGRNRPRAIPSSETSSAATPTTRLKASSDVVLEPLDLAGGQGRLFFEVEGELVTCGVLAEVSQGKRLGDRGRCRCRCQHHKQRQPDGTLPVPDSPDRGQCNCEGSSSG